MYTFIKDNKQRITKDVIILSLSILNCIVAWVLNISIMFGNKPNVWNVLVSIVYILIWIFILIILWKKKNRLLLLFYFLFWVTVSISTIITVLHLKYEVLQIFADFMYVIPVFTISQLNGFMFFDEIIHMIISCIVLVTFSLLFLLGFINSKKE